MARKRKVGNLLALGVLSVLVERPMHRYEIAATLEARGKDRDMAIKWGSLYTVVGNLEKHGFLEVVGSERDGARPERVIYRITAAGRAELADWTRELIADPQPEPRRFVAGLSVMSGLPPDEVIDLLGQRLTTLEAEITSGRAQLADHDDTLPRLFLVENDFELAMLEAEAAWVRALRDSFADGSFPEVELWRRWYGEGASPADITAEVNDRIEKGEPTRPDTN
ncbi:transcriptional regulator, Acidobacterial, PadR-family [Nocardia otitidiscaviarum]|uniref:Transcriptional regulator, Acidobacterial, PadR-family n=1 Tax=Nocardia otitidiscaviarum TaxID=1823 RepID=A0A378YLK6_9NOCA|nr:PadR family transcriptional regulator [Nocardia otitidiscaviarum]SUA77440.1 transcriptional regulator, Acidobacterial, PadR-family [Nocardia otitidiscaviarum]